MRTSNRHALLPLCRLVGGGLMLWGMFSWHTFGLMMHHVTKLKSFQIGFLNMRISSLY